MSKTGGKRGKKPSIRFDGAPMEIGDEIWLTMQTDGSNGVYRLIQTPDGLHLQFVRPL